MKGISGLTAFAGILGALTAAHADVTQSFDPNVGNLGNGLRGYHINAPTNDPQNPNNYPHGISLDINSVPIWSFGLSKNTNEFYFFSHPINGFSFRMRADTGQIAMGKIVPQPTQPRQLDIVAGTDAAPLAGVGITTYGDQNGVSLVQGRAGSVRSKINFNNQFHLGTDISQTGVRDLYFWNPDTNHFPLTINATDLVTLGYGATINGTATLNGPAALNGGATVAGSLQHTGNLAGFYNTAPIARPVITGCRCDGTALANLLLKLEQLGLIDDQTTP